MPLEEIAGIFPSSPLLSDRNSVDIVAVPGIFEDQDRTWIKSGTTSSWLRDLFPYKRLRCRVLTFTYDRHSLIRPGKGSADRILSHAVTLVSELCADRDLSRRSQCPIVFLCHGVGGLLVKRALISSRSRDAPTTNHLRSVFTSTYAILFFATPHLGISKEALLSVSQNEDCPSPSNLMINLRTGSELLIDITDQFAPLAKRFRIFNFWEQNQTSKGFDRIFIVDKESAAPIWDNVETCGIDGDHSEITRFRDLIDHGYRVVLDALSRYIKEAGPVIKSRLAVDIRETKKRLEQDIEILKELRRQASMPIQGSPTPDCNEWYVVPRCSTSEFVGRRMQAEIVHSSLGFIERHKTWSKPTVFVLYGLGGAGKTQFCLKYVEDNRASYWGVFWVDASNDENAKAAFADIGAEAGQGSTYTAGKHWLSRCLKPWLLVLDNADDPDLDISQYFPLGGNGHILVTTRNQRVIEHNTVGHLRFQGMEPVEGVTLLLRSAYPGFQAEKPDQEKWGFAEAIASELGYLALALAHAGAAIRRNIYSMEKYLSHYLSHRRETIIGTQLHNADDTNIITTWEIPFKRLANHASTEYSDAVDLLHTFAFMHFELIPERIFQKSLQSNDGVPEGISAWPPLLVGSSAWSQESQYRVRRALNVLRDFSIIEYDSRSGFCSLHPVVHRWTQDRLSGLEQRRWLTCTATILSRCIPQYLEASGRAFRRLLLPHIESCMRALTFTYPSLPETQAHAQQLESFASVFAENGLWKQARALQRKVIEFRKQSLGKTHESTLEAQRSLSYTHWNLFEVKAAIEIQVQILRSRWWRRSSAGDWLRLMPWKPEHISYCVALSDLTMTLWLAGQRNLSKRAGERAIIGLQKRLGPDDPVTLTAMFNLARTYLHLGDQEASHRLLITVLRKRRRLFGQNHPDTLMTRNELGMNLYAGNRHLAAAERLVRNVLQARKKILGQEHAYTLWSVNDLSKVLTARDRPREAAEMLEDIIPTVTRTLGEDHVGMIMTRSNLARAYVLSERWVEARTHLQELIDIVSSDHPDRFHIMSGYIHVRIRMGQLDEAEKDGLELLEVIGRTKVLALDDPRTIAVRNQLEEIRVLRKAADKTDGADDKKECQSQQDIRRSHPRYILG